MSDQPVLDGPVPAELVAIAERHGQVVAAGDNEATLADFRPDRTGQLIGSARLPDRLVSSRLLRLEAEPDGLVAAFIRYTAADGSQTVLRSRWIKLDGGLARHPGAQRPGHPAGDRRRRAAGRRARPPALGRPALRRGPRPALRAVRALDLGPAADLPSVPQLRPHLARRRAGRDGLLLDPHLAAVHRRTVRASAVRRGARGAARGRRPPPARRAARRRRRRVRIGQPVRGEIDPAPSPGAWPVLRWRLA